MKGKMILMICVLVFYVSIGYAVEMVYVEGGSFAMGSNYGEENEKPVHSVTVSSFYIGKYEVTQKEWKKIMGTNPSYDEDKQQPVEHVSWYEAVDFCNKLSEKEKLTPCYTGSGEDISCNFSANGYRLPTEAEWEYAARGGNKSKGYKYSGSNSIDNVAWFEGNSEKIDHSDADNTGTGSLDDYFDDVNEESDSAKPDRVGRKYANELDINDMSGNVYEWCNDWYGKYSSDSQTNSKGLSSGTDRVIRGGCFDTIASTCTVTAREYDLPEEDIDSFFGGYMFTIGFRIVRSK